MHQDSYLACYRPLWEPNDGDQSDNIDVIVLSDMEKFTNKALAERPIQQPVRGEPGTNE